MRNTEIVVYWILIMANSSPWGASRIGRNYWKLYFQIHTSFSQQNHVKNNSVVDDDDDDDSNDNDDDDDDNGDYDDNDDEDYHY